MGNIVEVFGTACAIGQAILVFRGLVETAKNIGRVAAPSPLDKAIRATERDFPRIEGLATTIRRWLEDTDVLEAFERFYVAPDDATARLMEEALVERAGFYMGADGQAVTRDVVCRFIACYMKARLAEASSMAIHDNLEALRYNETMSKLCTIEADIGELAAESRQGHFGRLLSSAKKQEGRHQYRAALVLYEQVTDAPTASESQRVDAMTGAGKCCARMGDIGKAVEYYSDAAEVNPSAARSQYARVRAALLGGECGVALDIIRRLREVLSDNDEAVCLEAEILLTKGDYEGTIAVLLNDRGELLTPALEDSARAAYLLSHAHYKCRKAEEAHSWGKACLTLDPRNVDCRALAAVTAIPKIAGHRLAPGQLDSIGNDLAKWAEGLLTGVLEELGKTDYVSKKLEAHVNRAAVRVYLGNTSGADEDCHAALAIDKVEGTAYVNLVHVRMLQRDWKGAVTAYRTGRQNGMSTEILPELTYFLLAHGEAQMAADLVREAYGGKPDGLEPRELMAATDALAESGQTDLAAVFFEALARALPDGPKTLLTEAHLQRAKGDLAGTEATLRTALSEADGHLLSQVRVEIAVLYHMQGRYDDAVPFYRDVVDVAKDGDLLRGYVHCLYSADDKAKFIPECAQVCARISGALGPVAYYLRHEASIAENLNQLQLAKELYTELTELEPNDAHALIRLGAVEYRLGNPEAAQRALDRVDSASVRDARTLMMMAEGFSLCEAHDKALRLSYDALRKDFRDPGLHLSYASLMLRRQSSLEQLLEASVADIDTAVTVEVEGDSRTYLLTDATSVDPTFKELHINTELGTQLRGTRVGDFVEINQLTGTGRAQVNEIVSKYVLMFRDVMQGFSERFPCERGGPTPIHIDTTQENPFGVLTRVLKDRAEYVDRVFGEYGRRRLPVAALAQLIGRDIVSTRDSIVCDRSVPFYCCSGSRPEIQEMLKTATASALVLDSTSVLTATDLGVFDLLGRMYDELLVPQSLDDCVGRALNAIPETAEGLVEAPKGELRYYLLGSYHSRRARLELVRSQIREKCRRVGRSTALSLAEKEYVRLVGEDGIDAMILARERGLPLYCDDMAMRVFARSKYGVAGVHTPALAEKARLTEQLSEHEYDRLLGKLIALGYVYLPMRGGAMAEALVGTAFDSRLWSTLDHMLASSVRLEEALQAIADLYRELWLRPIPPIVRNAVVQHTLQGLLQRTLDPAVIDRLLVYVQRSFLLLQWHLPEVERLLRETRVVYS